MAVCLVTGGNYHYSGLCDFSAITHYTIISAYASLRVNSQSYFAMNIVFYQLTTEKLTMNI